MGIVSHDLLNMLNAVLGASALIEKDVSQDNHVEWVLTQARAHPTRRITHASSGR